MPGLHAGSFTRPFLRLRCLQQRAKFGPSLARLGVTSLRRRLRGGVGGVFGSRTNGGHFSSLFVAGEGAPSVFVSQSLITRRERETGVAGRASDGQFFPPRIPLPFESYRAFSLTCVMWLSPRSISMRQCCFRKVFSPDGCAFSDFPVSLSVDKLP